MLTFIFCHFFAYSSKTARKFRILIHLSVLKILRSTTLYLVVFLEISTETRKSYKFFINIDPWILVMYRVYFLFDTLGKWNISSYSEPFEIFLSHNIFQLIAKRYFDMVGILCLKSSISNSYTYLDKHIPRISPEKQRPTLLSAEQSLGTQRE